MFIYQGSSTSCSRQVCTETLWIGSETFFLIVGNGQSSASLSQHWSICMPVFLRDGHPQPSSVYSWYERHNCVHMWWCESVRWRHISALTVSDSAQNLQLSLQTVANDLSSWFKSWALAINLVEKLPSWFFAPGKKFQPFLSLSMAVRSSKCVSRNTLVLTSMNGWPGRIMFLQLSTRLPQYSACYAGCDPMYHLWLSKLSSALVFFLFWSTHPLPGVVLEQSMLSALNDYKEPLHAKLLALVL